MDISISICSDSEDEYCITLSPFENSIIPDEIKLLLGKNIEIADITLERIKGTKPTRIDVLLKISNIIAEIFEENKNLILYFYCDDMHDILRRNKRVTPQKFRSDLFSCMFDKYITSNRLTNITNTPIEIIADRTIYIHLIARDVHLPYVNAIKDTIVNMASK